MKIGIGDETVGPHQNAIPDGDVLLTHNRAACHAKIITNLEMGPGSACAENAGMCRTKRIAAHG